MDERFVVQWLEPEDLTKKLETTSVDQLPLVIEIDKMSLEDPLRAATIFNIYERFGSKYGYDKNNTRQWLFRLTKMGWLWRPFKGGYRITEKARKWLTIQVGNW